MRTAISRAVDELANEGVKVFKTGYDKATWLLEDRLVVSDTMRMIFDPKADFTKHIPPFTEKRKIKQSIKRYLKTLKLIEFTIEENLNPKLL